jgi:DNA-binding NarL/FixJ family response regulator
LSGARTVAPAGPAGRVPSACRRARSTRFGGHDRPDLRRRAAEAGAVAYVTKDRPPRELVDDILDVREAT